MEYRNAKYINDLGWVDCEINHPEHGWIPYTLDPEDSDTTVDNSILLEAMEANQDVGAYVPPTQEELDLEKAKEVRRERDYLLSTLVDPIASNPLRWADISEETKQNIMDYRKALLDLPEQEGFPHNVVFPELPTY
jgi:hypothetical protein